MDLRKSGSPITTERSRIKMKMKRKPTSPGEILSEEFLGPLGITQAQLAKHIGCDVKVINRIVNGRTSVTAEMAIRLGAALRMTPEFWLNAQQAVDIYDATRRVRKGPAPFPLAGAPQVSPAR